MDDKLAKTLVLMIFFCVEKLNKVKWGDAAVIVKITKI